MVTGTDPTRPRTIEGITRPDPRSHYGQIVAWIVCWPWNLMWTFCIHNPFRYICEFVLREIQSTLDEIATGEFSQIERDLDERPAPSPASAPATREAVSLPVREFSPAVAESDTAGVETIDEASFGAANERTLESAEVSDQAAIETVEESSPAWEQLLKSDSMQRPLEAAVEPAPVESAVEEPEAYTPPAMPATPQDPWYYAPRGRQDGSVQDPGAN